MATAAAAAPMSMTVRDSTEAAAHLRGAATAIGQPNDSSFVHPNWQRDASQRPGAQPLPGAAAVQRLFTAAHGDQLQQHFAPHASQLAAAMHASMAAPTAASRALVDRAAALSLEQRPLDLQVTEVRTASAAAAAGAAGAPDGDGYCCPCLKACFEKVWAAVKWFFNMIADFFMNLFCPKTGAQLLKQNELLVDLIRPATDGAVHEDAVRDVFRGLPKSEQERIAKAAADLCCKQEPVESGEKAVQWLFSGAVELNVVLRRLLENAEMPSAPPAGTRAGDVVSGASNSLSIAEGQRLLRSNQALMALLNTGAQAPASKAELIAALETMPEAEQIEIAYAACIAHHGKTSPSASNRAWYLDYLKRADSDSVLTVLVALRNGRSSLPVANASGAAAPAPAAAADPHAEARGLLMGNPALVALLAPEKDPAPTKNELFAVLRTMSQANQEAVVYAACQIHYPMNFSGENSTPPTATECLAGLRNCTPATIIAILSSLLTSGQPADSKRG